MPECPYCDENGQVVVQAEASAIGAQHMEPCRICGGRAKPAKAKCPNCGAPEVEASTPRTVYACGSSDYDQRPGTFEPGDCGREKPVPEKDPDDTPLDHDPHPIPPMTHPLAKHWDQPPREHIVITPAEARMTQETMRRLATYDSTLPSGVYPGKMWLRNQPIPQTDKTVPLLCWYAEDGMDHCKVENRRIVVVDGTFGMTPDEHKMSDLMALDSGIGPKDRRRFWLAFYGDRSGWLLRRCLPKNPEYSDQVPVAPLGDEYAYAGIWDAEKKALLPAPPAV